jgi:hypothetical protein
MKGVYYLLICSILLLTVSCRSTRKIQVAITKKDTAQVVVLADDHKADSIRVIHETFRKIEENRIDFRTFSAKIKVNYQVKDGGNNDFTAFVNVRKDSVIWILIHAALGFEAFRVMITPDSVKVLDKLEKVLKVRSVNYLQEVVHIPINFHTLQDLLIGNPIYLDSNIVSYKKEANTFLLMSLGDIFKNYITLNSEDFSLLHSKLDDVDIMRARTCELTYAGYDLRGKVRFSTYRQISVAEKSKVDIQLNFKQYNFNESLSFPFPIPKNYKRN